MNMPPDYTRPRQGWVGAMRSNFLTGLVIIAPHSAYRLADMVSCRLD